MKENRINKYIFNVLKKIGIFLIIIFGGFYLFFGIYLPDKYKNTNDVNLKKWQLFYEGKANAEVLILGSSKALRGYNSKIISKSLHKKVYNFAELGMSLSNYPRFLHDYLQKNKAPEILMINLDIFGFNHRDRISTPYYMLPFISSDSRVLNEIYQFRYIKYCFAYGYFFYKDEIYKKIEFPDTRKDNFNGFEPQDIKWKNASQLNLKLNPNNSFGFDSVKAERYFNEVSFLVEKYSIKKTYFIMSPVFYNYLHKNSNWKEIVNFSKQKCQKFNIKFVDLLNDSISKQSDLFYDPIHFNLKGANRFSEILIKNLK